MTLHLLQVERDGLPQWPVHGKLDVQSSMIGRLCVCHPKKQGCGSTMRFCVLVVSSVSCSHLGVFYENLRNTGSRGSRVCVCWSWAGVWWKTEVLYSYVVSWFTHTPETCDKSPWCSENKGCTRCSQSSSDHKGVFEFQEITLPNFCLVLHLAQVINQLLG